MIHTAGAASVRMGQREDAPPDLPLSRHARRRPLPGPGVADAGTATVPALERPGHGAPWGYRLGKGATTAQRAPGRPRPPVNANV